MERRILVVFADYWISVGILRRLNRQIRSTILQGISGISLFSERTKMSKVPGKTSKVNNIETVLKPTQVDRASSPR